MKIKKKVIAVSGGVDSMLLAYFYRKKDVVLAYVNYNIRKDAFIDQKIVQDFATKYKKELEILNLDGKIPKNTNFENWARNIRYKFFKKIHKKYDCNEVLLAHHKDDLLETSLMQYQKNNQKLFYGIKQKIILDQMKINRPFLFKYWKSEIYKLAKEFKIDYHEDSTNKDNFYVRNNIRNNILSKMSTFEKENLLIYFNQINQSSIFKIKEIQTNYSLWSKSKFDTKIFNQLKHQDELIKIFINKRTVLINLNKNIIQNIIAFISSPNNQKQFLLSNSNYLCKKRNKLYLCKK